jgi:hypothetical protein
MEYNPPSPHPAVSLHRRLCSFRHPRIAAGLLLGLLALSLATLAGAGCARAWWARIGSAQSEPVYTLAALRASLERDPSAWLGRTVRMRAIPALRWCFVWTTPSPSCQLWEPALVGTGTGAAEPLPLAWGSAPAPLAYLRRVPVLGALAPPPQAIRWGAPGIYRVQLHATTCFAPGMSPCYEAMVLDSSP